MTIQALGCGITDFRRPKRARETQNQNGYKDDQPHHTFLLWDKLKVVMGYVISHSLLLANKHTVFQRTIVNNQTCSVQWLKNMTTG
jgi:hypothetical protein